MNTRLLLFLMGWCFGVVAWQTFAYPPDYLLGSAVWAAVAGGGSLFCVAAAVSSRRGVALVAGTACICHALGRSSAVTIQIIFREQFGLGAPFANYAIAASVWALIALLTFATWTHLVIPWSVLRRVARGGS